MHSLIAGAALSLALMTQQAPPAEQEPVEQTAPAGTFPSEATAVEEVVVFGRTEEVVRDFVQSLSVRDGYNGQLAQFDGWVCPGVVNMRPEYGRIVADRIGRVASLIGQTVGPPGCAANIMVIATSEADDLVPALTAAYPNIFVQHSYEQTGGRGRLRDFLASEAPVRWWHVMDERASAGPAPARLVSHFSSATRSNIQGAMVVVDLGKMDQVHLEALGDYIAMVALARLDPDMDTSGAPTILNLFAGDGAPPTEISEFDLAYLNALYSAPRDVAWGSMQERAIIWRMMRGQTAQ